MDDYERLKQTQKKLGSALACSLKKSGEILIYITKNADNDEVMKSLIHLTLQISQHRKETK